MEVLFLTLIGTLVGTVLAFEAQAWMPYLSRWLLKRTLDGLPAELPEDLRARWREEIEADFETYANRPVGSLWFAFGLRRKGGHSLAAELALQATLAPSGPARAEVGEQKTWVITEKGREFLRALEGQGEAEAILRLLASEIPAREDG